MQFAVLHFLALVGYLSICASLGLIVSALDDRVQPPLARVIRRAQRDQRADLRRALPSRTWTPWRLR